MSPVPERQAPAWRVALAAVPFLASIGLLGFAVRSGALMTFAILWPIIQVAGYVLSLRVAKGDLAHPVVNAQIALHWLMLVLVIALVLQAV